jgi:phage-related baseplate assembly protein
VQETLEAYRARLQTSAEETSTCGNRLAYEAAAKAVSKEVIDARAVGPGDGALTVGSAPSAGSVDLLIIKGSRDPEGNVISAEPEPDSPLITLVNAALQDEQVKKLTDSLTVKAPAYYDISPSVTYYIAKSRIGYVDEIKAAVEKAFDDWCVWQQAKIGRDVNPSELTARLVNAGAKRVAVSSPAYHAVHIDEVTRVGYSSFYYGGIEDD